MRNLRISERSGQPGLGGAGLEDGCYLAGLGGYWPATNEGRARGMITPLNEAPRVVDVEPHGS
jgi:hypothetical protein